MTATVSAVTDQEILAALRQAYFHIAISGNKSYTTNGRTFERTDVIDIERGIKWFESRLDQSMQVNGGAVLAVTSSY